jgi:hypothetical protein
LIIAGIKVSVDTKQNFKDTFRRAYETIDQQIMRTDKARAAASRVSGLSVNFKVFHITYCEGKFFYGKVICYQLYMMTKQTFGLVEFRSCEELFTSS